jgi:hypothetical protein
MLKAIIQEAAALASLALFIAMIAIWTQVLGILWRRSYGVSLVIRRLVFGRCVGWELKHFVFDASPASTERPAVVLDDNGAWNSTVNSQSRAFSDTRTGDGGFQGALVGEYQLTFVRFSTICCFFNLPTICGLGGSRC